MKAKRRFLDVNGGQWGLEECDGVWLLYTEAVLGQYNCQCHAVTSEEQGIWIAERLNLFEVR